MKRLVFFIFSLPLLLFSKEDTLYKKKFNLCLNFDLSIPQQRNTTYLFNYIVPNNSFHSSQYSPEFISILHQNAWNLFLIADRKIYKKFYLQTGLSFTATTEKSYFFGDSLRNYSTIEINNATLTTKTYNFTVPIGLQYRIKNYFLANIGVAINIHSILTQDEIYLKNLSQVFHDHYKNLSNNNTSSFIKYISFNIHILPRTYLSIKVSNTTFKPNEFKDNLYYSLGFKFFVI